MILSQKSIRARCLNEAMIFPFCEKSQYNGMSYGLSYSGYDVRLDQKVMIAPGEFLLASTLERFQMPNDLTAIVHDKSTLIRQGLCVFNTVIEPGWAGYLTLELKNNGRETLLLDEGSPIAQIVFHLLDQPVESGYSGKYQNQQRGPQEARVWYVPEDK